MLKHTLWRVGVPLSAIYLTAVSAPVTAQHEEEPHAIDEIIVTSALSRSKADTALPVHVLSDENLREQVTSTLGETLRNLPGVHSTSFGVGVGQPVIRGLSGNRVAVLQDSLGVVDASGVSQDHGSAVEPLLAERVEVLRGPATLLYGNGAIGGVVNVIDNRISDQIIAEAIRGALEIRHHSVNQNDTAVAKLEGGIGNFSWYLDGIVREGDDTDIPGFAIDETLLVEEHDDHDEEEHEEPENSDGVIENSSQESDQFTAGGAWHFDNGFVGASVSQFNNNYGIPPGAHGHDEEEGMEEEEHGEEFIRIDMEHQRVDLKGEFTGSGWLQALRWQLADIEYEHVELEGEEVGTRFVNDGREGRIAVDHGWGEGLDGTWGLQWTDRDFSAIGDEAFVPAVAIESLGVFAVERLDFEALVWELGLRLDEQDMQTQSACSSDEQSFSASASVLWRQSEDVNLYATLNRSQRAPSVEEGFSNIDINTCATPVDEAELVEHAATARVELGSPELARETANSLELGITRYRGGLQWEVNGFYTEFADFIYLSDIGTVADYLATIGVVSDNDETIVSQYLQNDATFYGMEGKVTRLIKNGGDNHVDISLFGDWVRARLDNGDFLPRIPPVRVGLELAWIDSSWSAKLLSTWVADQDNVADEESVTDGYVRWDAHADYHWNLNGGELLVFAKLNNLTDEDIRDHTSFLKAYAPAAGRDLSVGLRYLF